LPRADEVSGEPWQLITAFHDEGDGLILCEHIEHCVSVIKEMLATCLSMFKFGHENNQNG